MLIGEKGVMFLQMLTLPDTYLGIILNIMQNRLFINIRYPTRQMLQEVKYFSFSDKSNVSR